MQKEDIQVLYFEDDGCIPNNLNLPLVIYKAVFNEETVREAETILRRHDWSNSWMGGVFPYHHFHSTTHEVLVAVKGNAVLRFGGEQGADVVLQTGDAAVIPAGTGHKKLSCSSDFTVIGAYPGGRQYDTKTEKNDRTLQEISRVPLPEHDPFTGKTEPLLKVWGK
ncbi:cupin domain-containing protein [Bacillus sp. L381]|uniref:cupin domain-containing protein n=1 Tax=Bacillus TaxID=1386 RepID=UPI001BA6A085|nr:MULTISPECIES: cupin domain-containing protein [Bacillus]MCR9037763.1 cupin domain-containing protein [Bacillus velezensis]QUN10679.1 cupin domain-containing protein [Bacillus amyloliquefaciens]QYM83811.1 cupin domain-containing protein [Bacillus sp. 7D3]QZY12997.1 cupin domain-containing protein [Bacillus amyloliquefaciens]WIX22811.1 cupin domain-containing protein [Bacillus sp. L381]